MSRAGTRQNGMALSGRRRGFSLVEVLVVLVILIIGIFAIARLFPEGFVGLNYGAHVTLGDALTRLEQERLRQFREDLPDAIVAFDPATGGIRSNINPLEYYGPRPYTDNAIPGVTGTPPDDPRFSNVNIARHVIGETVKVPAPGHLDPTDPNSEYVSLYNVLFGPIYVNTTDPSLPSGGGAGMAAYSGTPLHRVAFENPPTQENWDDLTAAGAQGYGINYETATLYLLGIDYPRVFKLNFTFHTTPDTRVESVPNNDLMVGAGTAGQQLSFPLRTTAGSRGTNILPGGELDRGSELVYRRLHLIPPAQAFSSDPYEYKLYDLTLGLIGFHPALASASPAASAERGQIVKIDYDVDDWHILRQDEVVPLEFEDANQAAGNRRHAVKLATNIKKYLDVEDTINFVGGSQTTFDYQGLIRSYPAGNAQPARPGTTGIDLVMVDLETGYVIDSRTLQTPDPASPPGTGNQNGEIDYAKGIIHLAENATFSPPNSVTPPPATPAPGGALAIQTGGRHLRIYYRTRIDHAVAVSRPHAQYAFQPDNAQLADGDYTVLTTAAGTYLLFPTSETGKTVAVDYTYVFPGQTLIPNGTDKLMSQAGELYQLAGPNEAGDPSGGTRAWVRLMNPNFALLNDPGAPGAAKQAMVESTQVTGVRGVSLMTRVVWREARRWRHLERSTVLSRAETR